MAESADYAREQRWAEEITPGVIVGEMVYLTQKNGHKFLSLYAPAAGAKTAVVVVHGMGLHPDWDMIGTLRQRLVVDGFSTLSVQMPVRAADAKPEEYSELFSEAVERLQRAVAYLRAQSYTRVAIVSHSLGSRMSRVYMATQPPDVDSWVAISLTRGDIYAGIAVPVLDLYGERDLDHVLNAAASRKASFQHSSSRQQVVPNADHFFVSQERVMIDAVRDFLREKR